MKNAFNFCPECGSRNISHFLNKGATENSPSTKKWTCQDCGFDLYCNIASAVGAIIYDAQGNVLFEVRAKEPQKGKIVIPGGFTDCDETLENAVLREVKEECGLELSRNDISYICSYPNTYEYKNFVYKTCDAFFAVQLKDISVYDLLENLKAQESEVTAFEVHKVNSLEDIEKLPLAFESAKNAFKDYVLNHRS